MSDSCSRWVAWTGRHSVGIVITSLALCVLGLISLTRLRLELNVVDLLPTGAPAFDDFRLFVTGLAELDQLLILVEGGSERERKEFTDRFTARLSKLDTIRRVQERINPEELTALLLGKYLYNYLPEEAYELVERRLTPEEIEAAVAAHRVALNIPLDLATAGEFVQDPLGLRRLLAESFATVWGRTPSSTSAEPRDHFVALDGGALLISAHPEQPASSTHFNDRLMREVRDAEVETRREVEGKVRVRYTGSYVFALEDAGTMRGDMLRYVVLAPICVLTVLAISYRSLRILPFITYPIIVTTLTTLALSLIVFGELNALSISFAAILYGLSVDGGIHFYTRLLQEGQRQDVRVAITATLAGLGRAHVAAAATTGAVFFIIGFSCVRVVGQIGWLTGIGVLLNTIQFFTVYPALAFLLPWRVPVHSLETPRLSAVAEASARRPAVVIGTCLAVSCITLFGVIGITYEMRLSRLRPAESGAARVQEEIAARFGTQLTGTVVVQNRDLEEALIENERVERVLRRYEREGLVQAVRGVSAVLPSEEAQRARLARYAALPRESAIEELRVVLAKAGFVVGEFEPFFSDFGRARDETIRIGDPALKPLEFLIEGHIGHGWDGYVIATHVQPAPGVTFRTIADRLRGELGKVHVAARSLVEEELGRTVRQEMRRFFVLAVVANVMLLWIGFRSLRTSLVVLSPVVLVVLILLGAMGFAGMPLDAINLIVVPLVLGLGVDDCVYILAAGHRIGIGTCMRQGGRALVVTSLTTVVGFGCLGLSRYPVFANMGALSAAGLILAFGASVTVFPSLLQLCSRRGWPEPVGKEGW